MSPFVSQLFNAAARAAVIWIGARLGATMTESDAARIVVEYLAPAAMLLWSFYQKYKSQQKLNTALASSKPMSETQIEHVIATSTSTAPVPSVLTPKAEIPS